MCVLFCFLVCFLNDEVCHVRSDPVSESSHFLKGYQNIDNVINIVYIKFHESLTKLKLQRSRIERSKLVKVLS